MTTEDWTLTDEMLLDRLMRQKETRKMISDEYLGVLPKSLLTLQFPWQESDVFSCSRLEIQSRIEQLLNKIADAKWHVYVFKERGSFSKHLRIQTDGEEEHSFGVLSRSLIVYIFYSGSPPKGVAKEIPHLIESIASLFKASVESITKIYINEKDISDQSPLF
ncbi:hypothetical protein AU476_34315 [Cupriavidus sp. UYMSc13B]|nr:hypothetical protein AU476_34315 [Cupriavidus sp. UYMSc13B]